MLLAGVLLLISRICLQKIGVHDLKRIKVSNNVIRRLPRYLQKLDELRENGVDRISSGELGRQMNLTPSQIRQDFSCFGEFGQQGYGYNVSALRSEIARILGTDRNFTAVMVGVGNIGHALIENFSFQYYGVKLVAAFDVNPDMIGTQLDGIPIYDMKELNSVVAELHPDIAILCVPKYYANHTAQILVSNEIRGIWNFTNVELEVPEGATVVENIYFSDSLLVLGYYLSDHLDEMEARAARKRITT